jgi:nucleoside-diphosphate-sugar epimerase
VRYIARHGESRVAKAVLISAVPPLMVQTDSNPGGLPQSVFDDLQAQLAANRSEFYRTLAAGPFYGFNRPGAEFSEADVQNWWRQGRAVIGATGRQGGAVVRHLLDNGADVLALVRDPDGSSAHRLRSAGADVVRADLSDVDSLKSAFRRVATVFAMTAYNTDGPEEEVRQGLTVVDALMATEVPSVVYSSVGGADRSTSIPHFQSKWAIEERLRATGVPLTEIRSPDRKRKPFSARTKPSSSANVTASTSARSARQDGPTSSTAAARPGSLSHPGRQPVHSGTTRQRLSVLCLDQVADAVAVVLEGHSG